jgi:hypothetical protein
MYWIWLCTWNLVTLVLHDELIIGQCILNMHLNKFPEVLSKHNPSHHSNENIFFGQVFSLLVRLVLRAWVLIQIYKWFRIRCLKLQLNIFNITCIFNLVQNVDYCKQCVKWPFGNLIHTYKKFYLNLYSKHKLVIINILLFKKLL